MTKYKASYIEASVEVHARTDAPDMDYGQARRVTLSFRESFEDDGELDVALDAFTKTIKEAARR